MSSPRVACVGAGVWGRKVCHHLHALGALAWVCDPDPQARDEAAKRWPDVRVAADLEEALADGVDGVAITSPADSHGRLARQALLAGADVFVEKPLCLSLAEGRSLVALAESRGRVLMVGHLLWYHPAVSKLAELVAEGALGPLRYVCSNRLNLGRARRDESVLWSFAPHDLSVILGLLGEMPERVEASGGSFLDPGVCDVAVSTLAFPSGVKAHVFVSWLHPVKEHRLFVIGERQMAVFDDGGDEAKLRLYPYTVEWDGRVPQLEGEASVEVPIGNAEPLREECLHFLDRLADRGRPRTNGSDALRVLEVLERCQAALDGDAVAPASAGAAFVHPSSHVDEGVEIGAGTRVWRFSHLRSGARIGRDCSLGQNVVVGPRVQVGDGVKLQDNVSVVEGVTLENHVFCGPSVTFTNVRNPRSEIPRMHELRETRVRRGATLGANATLLCGIDVGRYAFVGAGAVVLRDVPDHALVVGNPARRVGWMCRCGHRIEGPSATAPGAGRCTACGQGYRAAGEGLAAVGPAD